MWKEKNKNKGKIQGDPTRNHYNQLEYLLGVLQVLKAQKKEYGARDTYKCVK